MPYRDSSRPTAGKTGGSNGNALPGKSTPGPITRSPPNDPSIVGVAPLNTRAFFRGGETSGSGPDGMPYERLTLPQSIGFGCHAHGCIGKPGHALGCSGPSLQGGESGSHFQPRSQALADEACAIRDGPLQARARRQTTGPFSAAALDYRVLLLERLLTERAMPSMPPRPHRLDRRARARASAPLLLEPLVEDVHSPEVQGRWVPLVGVRRLLEECGRSPLSLVEDDPRLFFRADACRLADMRP